MGIEDAPPNGNKLPKNGKIQFLLQSNPATEQFCCLQTPHTKAEHTYLSAGLSAAPWLHIAISKPTRIAKEAENDPYLSL